MKISILVLCSLSTKGPLSGLRQFLTSENPLRMMKNAFQKVKVNFKVYDVTGWGTNNYNTHIT